MTHASPLADSFPPASAADWRALVEKTLKDSPFDSLRRTTVEGLPIAPLYPTAQAQAAFTARVHDADQPWDVRVSVAHPDPAGANADLLTDLVGGATSAIISIDPTGECGVAAGSAQDLDRVLDGVMMELAPIGLDAGYLGPKAADWLAAAAKGSPSARLAFHLDPFSAFARTGASPGPIEAHLISAATVAARLRQAHPKASLFLASGRVVHEAGGGEAGELAFAIASAIAYAKGQVRAGVPMSQAFDGVVLGLSADTDYFVTLAKHRAARVLWTRVTGACGSAAPAELESRSSGRMLSVQDPWTNMLRLAAAAVGASLGGADAIMLGTFTDAIGRPIPFARRQSRNTQFVLMEEAHLGRVADPAAGSGYVEALTDQIARAAWARLQAIEAQGGLVAALTSGHVHTEIADVCEARDGAGVPKIVGVTAFPPTQAAAAQTLQANPSPVEAPSTRLPGPDSSCPPLTPIRLAEPHEAIR